MRDWELSELPWWCTALAALGLLIFAAWRWPDVLRLW
jgi:hypothetical protein